MSVKFRNPKTGEVFEVTDCCSEKFCANIKDCLDCPIFNRTEVCADWTNANPHEAAKLMGYEVVEENVMDDKIIKQWESKPHICEVLGLDVNEKFTVENEDGTFHISNVGQVTTGAGLMNPRILCDIINHPEKINLVPSVHLSNEEKALIKAIQLLYPRVRYIKKTNDGVIVSSICGYITTLQHLEFPNLPTDKEIDITNDGE